MRLSIGAKLWAGFISILLVFAIVGGIAYRSTVNLTEAAKWREHTYEVLDKLNLLLGDLQDIESGQRGYVITGNDIYLKPTRDAFRDVEQLQMKLRQLTSDNQAQQLRLEKLRPMIEEKIKFAQQTIEMRRGKGFDAARAMVATDQGKDIMDSIRSVIGSMADEESGLLNMRDREAESSSRDTLAIILLGTILASLLVLGAGYFLARNISMPLKSATRMAERIAAGDLAVELDYTERADEIGMLMRANSHMVQSLQKIARIAQDIATGDLTKQITPQSEKDMLGNAFAEMVNQLRNLTLEIREGMAVLTGSSSEILATTAQVASSAASTATAVNQTTTTVEEVKQTALMSSQKARQVSDSAQKTAQISQSGRQAIEHMIEGMKRIREQTASTAESIAKLNDQSHAISEIIATVNELAEQSSVLAVNAAIEAAKAGDQGRGFAVVAQEIKSLAEQSKQATAQVRSILGDIRKATDTVVIATDMNGRAVAEGARQSQEADTAIHTLEESITDSAQAAIQIAASSQQQLVGMDQVVLAMDNIKQASLQNMAGTKQAETAAQNLHELGIKLKLMVEKYKV